MVSLSAQQDFSLVLGGPFFQLLLDLEVHIRILVTMPLLIAAELIVNRRMSSVVKVLF